MTDDAPYEPSGQTMAVMGWTPEDQPATAPRAKAKPDLSALRRFIWSLDLADRAEVLLPPTPTTPTPPPEYSEALAIVERHQDGEGEGPSGTEVETVFTAFAALLEKHLPFARARASAQNVLLNALRHVTALDARLLPPTEVAAAEAEIADALRRAVSNGRALEEAAHEQTRVQLAGCSVAALGGTGPDQVAKRGDYGWSASYGDVLNLRLAYEEALERLNAPAGSLPLTQDELAKALDDSFEELGGIGARSIADFVWDLFAPLTAELAQERVDHKVTSATLDNAARGRDALSDELKEAKAELERVGAERGKEQRLHAETQDTCDKAAAAEMALQRENASLRAQAKWAPTRDAILNALRLGRINAGAAQTVDNSTADEIQKLLATPRTVRTTEIAEVIANAMAAANGHVIAHVISAHHHAARAVLASLGLQDSGGSGKAGAARREAAASPVTPSGADAAKPEPPVTIVLPDPLPETLPEGARTGLGNDVSGWKLYQENGLRVYERTGGGAVLATSIDWDHYRTLVQKDT